MKRIAGIALLLAVASSASESDPGWLGMVIRWSRDSAGERLLVVVNTTPNGPAAKGGLRANDRSSKFEVRREFEL